MRKRKAIGAGQGNRIFMLAGMTLACVALVGAGVLIRSGESRSPVPGVLLAESARTDMTMFGAGAQQVVRVFSDGRVARSAASQLNHANMTVYAADRRVNCGVLCAELRKSAASFCRLVVGRRSVYRDLMPAGVISMPILSEGETRELRPMRDLEIGHDWIRFDGGQISGEEFVEVATGLAESDFHGVVVVPFEDVSVERLIGVLDVLADAGVEQPYLLP